jgi:AcrR family transcriptional regulator
MTPPIDARAKRSQKALLQAGLELLNTNPDASLSDIAVHAGVGRTTLYRQYETREKLINAIATYCLGQIEEATLPMDKAKSAMKAIHLLFKLAMPLTQEMQFLINLDQIQLDDPDISKIINKQRDELTHLVEWGKRNNEISKTLPTSWVVNLIDGMFYIGWVQQQDSQNSTEQIAAFAYTSFAQGVSS